MARGASAWRAGQDADSHRDEVAIAWCRSGSALTMGWSSSSKRHWDGQAHTSSPAPYLRPTCKPHAPFADLEPLMSPPRSPFAGACSLPALPHLPRAQSVSPQPHSPIMPWATPSMWALPGDAAGPLAHPLPAGKLPSCYRMGMQCRCKRDAGVLSAMPRCPFQPAPSMGATPRCGSFAARCKSDLPTARAAAVGAGSTPERTPVGSQHDQASRPSCSMASSIRDEDEPAAWDDLKVAARQLCMSMSGFESSHSGEAMAH